jgi:DNA-binding PadR family transcriptional regulator
MSIKYIILGYLSWQPMTGYDVKKLIADSEILPWTASNNQIYQALVELHKHGWVTKSIEEQIGTPNRHVYTITEAGLQALRDWVVSEPEAPLTRKPFLHQLMWADNLNAQEMDALLEAYLNAVGEAHPARKIPVGYDPQELDRPIRDRTQLDSTDTPGARTNGSRSSVGEILKPTQPGT